MSIALQSETWGTYSVRDHCRPRAFVADVLLYDRLVIPYPPNDDEVGRWREAGWEPDRLKNCLEILGDLAIPLPWDKDRREQFKDRWNTARNLDPYYVTSVQMKLELDLKVPKECIPIGVGSVRPIAAYQSWDDFKASFDPQPVADVQSPDVGRLMAVLAHEFLVPEDSQADDLKNLANATAIARDDTFRGERNVFHNWLNEKIRVRAIEPDIIAELRKKIRAFKWTKRIDNVRPIAKYAHWTLELLPPAAVLVGVPWHIAATGEAAVRFVSFGLERFGETKAPQPTPAALFYDAQKRLG